MVKVRLSSKREHHHLLELVFLAFNVERAAAQILNLASGPAHVDLAAFFEYIEEVAHSAAYVPDESYDKKLVEVH
jgi:hypothetical protein